MLKYIVALIIINFCGAENRIVGKYNQIIMAQAPAVVKFFKQNYEEWPSPYTNYSMYVIGRKTCVSLFEQSEWVLHGVWPYKLSGQTPTFCNKGPSVPVEYHPTLLDDTVKRNLTIKWPTFAPNKSLASYVELEWNKHGCCMLDAVPLRGVNNYFEKSMNLLDEYNVGTILRDAGINPGHSYSVLRIQSVLRRRFNVKTYVKCLQYMDPAMQFLAEVEICFNKKLKLQDCLLSSNSMVYNCDLGKEAFFPIYTID